MNKVHWQMILLATLVLLALLILPACNPSPATTAPPPATSKAAVPATPMLATTKPAPADQPQYGGTLKILTTTKLTAFGPPVEVEGDMKAEILLPIWDPLVSYDANATPLPNLASVDISPDGKTMTFSLKKGVKFHDGTEFQAEAVKYHIQNFKFLRTSFDAISSMDILDPYTIRCNLSTPKPGLVLRLGGSLWAGINSPTAVKKPPLSAENKEHIAGAGPFKFVEWMRDTSLKVVKNNDYWDKGYPYLDAIEFKFFADTTGALMSLQAGEGQMLFPLAPKEAMSLKGQGYNIISGAGTTALLCPDSKPGSPFTDKRVREALEYAIDKKTLCDTLGYGFWTPRYQVCPPDKYAYVPGLAERRYDKAKAKQLLAEAGYPNGFATTIFTPTGDLSVQTALQGCLAEVGITAKIDAKTMPAFMEQGRTGWTNGLRYWSTGLDVDPLATYSSFYGREISHFMAMDKPESMMAAVDKASQEPDTEKRKPLLQSVTRTLNDEALIAPLWTQPSMAVTAKSVHGVDLYSIDIHKSTPAKWWLSK